ncbi:MAG TPA: hypothetical protein VG753_00515 [Candidatus Paceibacterota bacterium]|nr:hypothetical protein [Candidatus Paceibacterota bacterium]
MNMHIRELDAPSGLLEKTLARLSLAARRRAQLAFALHSIFALGSLAALLPAVAYAGQQFAASGFSTYLSLIFSDSGAAATYWRELGLSLMDSLPSLALIAVIVPLCVFIWAVLTIPRSARSMLRYA